MAKYPDAAWRPLAAGHQLVMDRHDIICLHTMVGTLTGTDGMFHANGWSGTESHFGVGGPWGDKRDGQIYQWGDTAYRADANLDGNRRVISIETGDNAPQSAADILPWSEKQLTAIVGLVAWLCKTHDIPAVLVPDSGPGRRGIAYHRQGVQHSGGTHPVGFLQPGCERWSTSVGKECPGPARIAQMPEILSRVQAELKPRPAPTVPNPEENNMALSDTDIQKIADANAERLLTTKVQLTASEARAMSTPEVPRAEGDELSVRFLLMWGGGGVSRIQKAVEGLATEAPKTP